MAEQQFPTPSGVIVSTAIAAGGDQWQHAEGVVVSTDVGAGGVLANHAEVLVGCAPMVWAMPQQQRVDAWPRARLTASVARAFSQSRRADSNR